MSKKQNDNTSKYSSGIPSVNERLGTKILFFNISKLIDHKTHFRVFETIKRTFRILQKKNWRI